jgi:uncharacterized protein
MRITLTGATGLIGTRLVTALLERGDEVTVLSRDAERARSRLPAGVEAVRWDPSAPAPVDALSGRDGVIHLAGENLAQRWTDAAKERIRRSREEGTRHLVAGLEAADPRPPVLVSANGAGYYGPRGDEPVTEDEPPGSDFLAQICVLWEREALAARELGMRVAIVRTGVVLDREEGALGKMLLPFRLGVGGPVAGGDQYMPWVHPDDAVGTYLAALDGDDWSGPVNATAPEGATNKEFSKALGRVLRRPAVAPVPGLALKVLYGEMSHLVLTGQNVVPSRPLALGYEFAQPRLDEALRDALER